MDSIESGKVIHAGTTNSDNASVAAALATLELLEEPGLYERLHQLGQSLRAGLSAVARKTGQNMIVRGYGPIAYTGFSDHGYATDYRSVLLNDKAKLSKFIAGMHDNGIRVIGRGLWYISAAHEKEDIQPAIEVAGKVLSTL